MTQQQKNNSEQKQKLKKYLVFAIMFLVFGICMWLIFAPSGDDKEAQQEGAGFNTDIPDPKGDKIVGDKMTAYEQEQMRLKQEEKMRSLQDYSFMLDANNDNSMEALEIGNTDSDSYPTNQYTSSGSNSGGYSGYSGRHTNSFEASNSAYMDINRTLGNFYDPQQDEDEKEELLDEIEQLKTKLEEQEKASLAYDDQLSLLEKSYQLAAKYTSGGQADENAGSNINTGSPTSGRKTKVVSVSRVRTPIVSSLQQPISNLEFVKQYSGERNFDFNTLVTAEASGTKNTIGAVVHGDQTLVNGQSVKLRITEAFMAGEHLIPRNTIVSGIGKIAGERLEIIISSIEYEGNIIPVNMQAYDSDAQQGIYIPGSMEMQAMKEIAGNLGQNLNSTINISQQSAGQQLLTDLGRGAIQGASQYISKKAREIKVTLKAGYRIFLLPDENN